MSDPAPPAQHSSAQALKLILQQAQKINAEHCSLLTDVQTHEEQLAQAHMALGKLHTRVVALRDSARALRLSMWWLPCDGDVSHESRTEASNLTHELQKRLDDLAWRLIDFRERHRGDH